MTNLKQSIYSIADDLTNKHGQNAALIAIKLMVKSKESGNFSEQNKWMKVADVINKNRFLSDVSGKTN